MKDGVRCDECLSTDSDVIDSRPSPGKIRRRRMCNQCGNRFTTVEVKVEPRVKLIRRNLMLMRAREMTYQQIADRMGVSLATVWNKING